MKGGGQAMIEDHLMKQIFRSIQPKSEEAGSFAFPRFPRPCNRTAIIIASSLGKRM